MEDRIHLKCVPEALGGHRVGHGWLHVCLGFSLGFRLGQAKGGSSCSALQVRHDARICGSTADEKDVKVCPSGRPRCEHLEEAREHPCDHYTADKTEHPPSGDCRTGCKRCGFPGSFGTQTAGGS